MGLLAKLLGITPIDEARANCHGPAGITPYQASLMPGDVNYQCNSCGQTLLGGFLGLGWCNCQEPK